MRAFGQHVATCSNMLGVVGSNLKPRSNFSDITTQHNPGPVFASSDQTIATFQRNRSQHCLAQYVAYVWSPCCDVLRHVASCACSRATLLHEPGQTTTTSCNIQKYCMENLITFKFEPTTRNLLQQIATEWPNARKMLHPTMLRYVALKCCERLAGA